MAKSDENKTANEQKTAGNDEARTQKASDEAAAEQEATPTSPEKREESTPSDSGEKTGAVVHGDIGAHEDAEDEVEAFEDGSDLGDLGVTGTVVEQDAYGDEYEVPYVMLTSDSALVRTSDSDDSTRSWTSQEAGERKDEDPVALVEVAGTPGQTFRVRELPNRDVVEAAGINYEQWVSGLPVRADVGDDAPRRGIPA